MSLDFKYKINGSTVEIVQAKNTNIKKVNIPEKVLFMPVTKINDSAFENCSYLQSVRIPDSVEYIGKNAFKGCIVLSELKVPNSVKTIGDGAFDKCASLKQIDLPFYHKIDTNKIKYKTSY